MFLKQPSTLFVTMILSALFVATPVSYGQQQDETAKKPSRYDLLVQYAKTNLELAEVELEQAVAINSRSQGVIPRITLERLRSNHAVAKEQYEEAVMASYGGQERVRLRHADEKIRLAKLALDGAKRQQSQRGVVPLELKRLELKYELAKLNRTLIENPENFLTLFQRLESQVDRLGDEILSLDQRITKLEPIRN